MSAPATPGDSVPGDAAGDDSGQGSESSGETTDPVIKPEGDAAAYEVTSVYAWAGGIGGQYTKRNDLTPYNTSNAEEVVLEFEGSDLDKIEDVSIEVATLDGNDELTLTRRGDSTPEHAYFTTRDLPEGGSMIITAIILDNKDYIDNRSATKRAYVDAYASESGMGYVTGGGYKEYGSTATLTAVANPGYHFVRWEDNDTEGPVRTFVASTVTTYTVIFAPDE